MKTKKGETIPQDLAQASGMLIAWDKLRPSCQEDYVELVMKAKDAQMRERTIQRVLKMTSDYHQRHPEKYDGKERKKELKKR